jgi:transcriptional regulator with XRE-family HTH domain
MPRITRLRHVLINSAVTQQTVAREANVPASKLSAYALGRAPIPPHYLIRLCKYFSLNPESLLGYIDAEDIIDWPKESRSNV